MKLFSTIQIKEWDTASIEEQNISAYQLMECAAAACIYWLKEHLPNGKSFYVFCGNGNNGGDGLALARLLIYEGIEVKVVLLNPQKKFSVEAAANLTLLQQLSPTCILDVQEALEAQNISPEIFFVDALWGTGLNRPLDAAAAKLINVLNSLPNKIISIDIPSGLFPDKIIDGDAVAVIADFTLSFQTCKRSFLHKEVAPHVGKLELLDIGLSKIFETKNDTPFLTIDEALIHAIYRPRNPYSHKGDYGTAVLVGGSYGMMGAIALSAQAALRVGAGKVYVQAPSCGYHILQTLIPEAMYKEVGEHFVENILPFEKEAMGLGPGMGVAPLSAIALELFLKEYSHPLVIDADALNMIAQQKERLLPLLPENSIITPHPKEFERLFGATENTLERVTLALEKAVAHKIYIILKGHHTQICTPHGKCFYNTTGNAGMATAGSGDVLTGILTGLCAQKYLPEEAALLGVYLHGLAGDLAAAECAQEALVAGDLIRFLGKAFIHIQQ